MFPHVNLCPLLESHLRGCAETKGLITPDAAGVGRGRCAGRGGSLHTLLSGAMASCFFVVVVGASPPPLLFNNKTLDENPSGSRGSDGAGRGDLAKLKPGGFLQPPGMGPPFVGRGARRGRCCPAPPGPCVRPGAAAGSGRGQRDPAPQPRPARSPFLLSEIKIAAPMPLIARKSPKWACSSPLQVCP